MSTLSKSNGTSPRARPPASSITHAHDSCLSVVHHSVTSSRPCNPLPTPFHPVSKELANENYLAAACIYMPVYESARQVCVCVYACVNECTRDLDLDKGPAEFATGVDEHEGAQAICSVCPCPNLDAKRAGELRKPGRQAGESPLSKDADARADRQARQAISIQSGIQRACSLSKCASVCLRKCLYPPLPFHPPTDRPTLARSLMPVRPLYLSVRLSISPFSLFRNLFQTWKSIALSVPQSLITPSRRTAAAPASLPCSRRTRKHMDPIEHGISGAIHSRGHPAAEWQVPQHTQPEESGSRVPRDHANPKVESEYHQRERARERASESVREREQKGGKKMERETERERITPYLHICACKFLGGGC